MTSGGQVRRNPLHKTVQGLGFLRIEYVRFNLPNINYINCKSYLAAI